MLGEEVSQVHHHSSAIQVFLIHHHHAEATSPPMECIAQECLVAEDPIFHDRVVLVDGGLCHKESCQSEREKRDPTKNQLPGQSR